MRANDGVVMLAIERREHARSVAASAHGDRRGGWRTDDGFRGRTVDVSGGRDDIAGAVVIPTGTAAPRRATRGSPSAAHAGRRGGGDQAGAGRDNARCAAAADRPAGQGRWRRRPSGRGGPEPERPPDGAVEAPSELSTFAQAWQDIVDAVGTANPLCAALLADAHPVALDGTQLTVAFAETADFMRRKVDDDAYRAYVAAAVRVVTGHDVRITYVLQTPDTPTAAAAAALTDEQWVQLFIEASTQWR